ncbi:MAG: Flp pilus assembly complex ATPase component TadA [Fimbriimonas ginsengisoli]|uniref:Flp pilus assembly complex ATPase component TadA n=1 Tax=Fimbriimonas ginsengisoli TaxID=1005039 RepID=A0A931PUP6_FIMGI|nr:Flp pilus assembly complex ATPase component TadA [Fimbriimonas ginsengisoli]
MANVKKRIGEHLVSLKLITNEQLAQALAIQRETPAPLGSILVSLGFLSEDLLLNALASQMNVSPWRLEEKSPTVEALRRVPGHICRAYHVLPVAVRGDLLVLAMRNPLDLDAIDLVRNFSNMRIEPVLAASDRLVKAIDESHGGAPTAQGRLDGLVSQALKDYKIDPNRVAQREDLTEADTRPVVGLVNQILADAIRLGASDVHIEPRARQVDIRYRVDGMLLKVREVPLSLHPMLATRLKIMAQLDIVEFRVPQDGRVTVELDDRTIDLRVSVLPNQHGQRIVLRILDKTASFKTLQEIGFSEDHLRVFRTQIRKPYGILLVTGPTGSGKTTTLYAALSELKGASTNIMTCEDPIEYEIDGISQSQVNEKVGLTFASQLRATLRQDPDIIMVGEIRDGETADTAIRAALTGHLVLSTLHCNDAPSSIPRLLDMEVDPFLLSTCLVGVVSQRLLRLLCPDCRESVAPTEEELQFISGALRPNEVPVLWKAKGCGKCFQTGFKGRTAVHEIMSINAEISSAISSGEPLERLRERAAVYGYLPLAHHALRLVLSGHTSLEEARRQILLESQWEHEAVVEPEMLPALRQAS